MANIPSRITDRIEQTEACWLWRGRLRPDGYGECGGVAINGKRERLIHRVMFLLAVGPIPDGCEIDHICKIKPCCNPAHLRAVTHAVNCETRDDRSTWTHCSHGHEFTPENTMVQHGQYRACRECHNETNRRNRPPMTEWGQWRREVRSHSE